MGAVRHVCAFFASEDEEYRVLIPFIREGLSCGDKAVNVIDAERRNEHLRRLTNAGIDSAAYEQSGQLQILSNTEVYLRQGRFDQDHMLAAFEEMAACARGAEGFPLSRIVCRMDWASDNQSRMQDVIEFEARVNDVWRRYDDVVICTYHFGKLSGDAVIDIMRTHPMVIIGGSLQHNPFFMAPEEFLREFRGRRAERTNL
jgi:DcmR-like sensory protein